MKKVHFITLGCKTNQYETNSMGQMLLNANYEITDGKADIYIVNTCSVTNMAERKSREMIRRAKRDNPGSTVIACGCYAQVAKENLEKFDEIDLVIGTNEKNDIVQILDDYFQRKDKNKVLVSDVMHDDHYFDFGVTTYTELTRAIIKIQDGCDRFCSYCIIPYARGRVRSRRPESVIKEVKELAKIGVKEIVVTGIHVASYGKDFKEDIGLIDLLEELNKIDGIERIRLGSIEPTLINEDFLDRLIKLEKICHHFHLSLQSACNETLKRMNRRYSVEEFKDVVNLLRKTYKDVILTTDIIVGFPGETEEEFNITYKNLQEINFYKMHVFKYSKREGTKAAVMSNQISPKVREERSKKLIKLSNNNENKYNEELIDKEVKVLFEEKDGNFIKGHTDNYIVVKVEKEDISKYHNEIKIVKIIKIENNELIGKIL